MQDRARVVIVGAGIAGASIAYHLARLGWGEVVVVERSEPVSGTTSHAPGLVGQLRSSPVLTGMLKYSVSLYCQLKFHDQPGYLEVGSLRLASSPARWQEIQRQAIFAQKVGLEAHLLSPHETATLFPLISLQGVEGALYLPHDGSAVAPILATALINQAQTQGISFLSHTVVQSVEVTGGRVRAVHTNAGRIETETLVVAAGIWSPLIGQMAGVPLALTPMQHQYALTESLPALAGQTLPNLRDPDKLVYLRQQGDTLVIGGYERNPRVFSVDAIPNRPDPTVYPFDRAHFEPLYRGAVERVPAVGSVGLSRGVNGLESFTPDGEFLLGPSTQVQGFWAACGFCAHGVSSAGGVGRVLAQWIVNGDPGVDLRNTALERFGNQAADTNWIQQRASEVYRTYYDVRKVQELGAQK
jgi:4-methylaminobutanoate oxidase (formaldehyde-forming)